MPDTYNYPPYWAIRHLPSGQYLPCPPELSHGFSRVEPGPGIPRLFPDKGSATRALGSWLRGAVTLKQVGWGDCYETEFRLTKRPERKAHEMAVVRVGIGVQL